jgi:hypothetical protein
MKNSPAMEELALAIEDIRERSTSDQHSVIDLILTEVRKTHKIIEANDLIALNNDLQRLETLRKLASTYLTIQAY